ncbi:hypothetical protein [Mesorhizobium sp. CAU 1741]
MESHSTPRLTAAEAITILARGCTAAAFVAVPLPVSCPDQEFC